MNPLTIGLAAVGIGLQAYGAFGAAKNAKQQVEVSKRMAADEMAINEQKKRQMELEANRAQVQNLRNAQRLRAQASAAAVNQGANQGSGIAGGLAQITGMENWNALNLGQNLSIGETIFGLNNQISGHKMQLSQLQGENSTNQALMSLGGAVVNNSGTVGNFFGSSSGKSSNPYYAPLDYNG